MNLSLNDRTHSGDGSTDNEIVLESAQAQVLSSSRGGLQNSSNTSLIATPKWINYLTSNTTTQLTTVKPSHETGNNSIYTTTIQYNVYSEKTNLTFIKNPRNIGKDNDSDDLNRNQDNDGVVVANDSVLGSLGKRATETDAVNQIVAKHYPAIPHDSTDDVIIPLPLVSSNPNFSDKNNNAAIRRQNGNETVPFVVDDDDDNVGNNTNDTAETMVATRTTVLPLSSSSSSSDVDGNRTNEYVYLDGDYDDGAGAGHATRGGDVTWGEDNDTNYKSAEAHGGSSFDGARQSSEGQHQQRYGNVVEGADVADESTGLREGGDEARRQGGIDYRDEFNGSDSTYSGQFDEYLSLFIN